MKGLYRHLFPLLFIFCIIFSHTGTAQNTPKKKLRIDLNKEKGHYLQFAGSIQIWSRYTESNPGSLVDDEIKNNIFDLSIRRYRVAAKGQLNNWLSFYTSIGGNSYTYLSEEIPLKLLDAQLEFKFSSQVQFGLGKTAWRGLSRYAAPSTSSPLGYDIQMIMIPAINYGDVLLRRPGLYLKGQIDKLDYRFSLSKPYHPNKNKAYQPQPREGIALFANQASEPRYSTYLKWQFWDKEPNSSPYVKATYLGKKKIMNLGIGMEYQDEAQWCLENNDTLIDAMKHLAIDYFLDMPVNSLKGDAFTLYLAAYHYDFGPNYIRNIGISNPSDGLSEDINSFNGKGNAFPAQGTGNSFYAESAYLLPKFKSAPKMGQVQVYGSFQYSDFERLDDPVIIWNLGTHWFLKGQASKLSLNLQNRPVFTQVENQIKKSDRKNMLVLQYQIIID